MVLRRTGPVNAPPLPARRRRWQTRPMLYMVVERYRGSAEDIYRRLRERGRQMPDGLEYVASWVTTDLSLCYQLMRTEDRALFDPWVAAWSDLVEFEIRPVQTSADAAAAAARP